MLNIARQHLLAPLALSHEVKFITPAEAKALLARVRNTAPLDQRQVLTYARDMAAGQWKLNGDPIILDIQGTLLSGRLRLHACIKAEIAFPTLIVRGIDPAHFDSIDAVRRRTAADVMSIRRERSGRALAAALAVLWRFENDDFPSISKKISSQALVTLLENHPELRISIDVAKSASPRLPHGLGAALHYMFTQVDPRKADAFFGDLASNDMEGRTATSSLKRQLDESLQTGGMRSQAQLAGLTIKAWESYRAGKPVAFVRYAPGSDQFPMISGLKRRGDGKDAANTASSPPFGRDTGLRDLSVKVLTVTPDLAQSILDRNDRNRGIAAAVVEKYARDMRNGTWALNGQTIKIADNGRLLDGQHRCAAAVKSGVPFQAIIVEGLDESVFDTFDVGARRSIMAILKDRGESNTAVLGAVLRQVWLLENDLIMTRNVPPTVSELIATLERHPDVRESVKFSNIVREVAPSIALALHYYFAKVSREKADAFLQRLGDGVMLGADNPIYKLREIFLENRANKKAKLGDSEKAALIIKSWNNYYLDRPIRVLKWQTSGVRKEPFPAISGLY